jgi:hypothetical protein
MGVLQRRARRGAVILEHEDEPKTNVPLEIHHPIAVGPQDIFDRLGRQVGEGRFMIRRLNDDFMRADAVHSIVEAHAFPSHVAFHLERRKLIRDDAHGPPRSIRLAVLGSIGEDFMGRETLLAGTKGAHVGRRLAGMRVFEKIARPAGPLRRNNNPTPDDRIATQFRHLLPKYDLVNYDL